MKVRGLGNHKRLRGRQVPTALFERVSGRDSKSAESTLLPHSRDTCVLDVQFVRQRCGKGWVVVIIKRCILITKGQQTLERRRQNDSKSFALQIAAHSVVGILLSTFTASRHNNLSTRSCKCDNSYRIERLVTKSL